MTPEKIINIIYLRPVSNSVNVKMRDRYHIIIMLILMVWISTPSYSQSERRIEVNAQAILARVDRILSYPPGQMRGRLQHVKPNGVSFDVNFTGYIDRDDYLFIFSSKERGDQLKVLYNFGGEDIWVYNLHSVRLYHKMGIDKYDSILLSNFFYIDMSNAPLQSNYSASIQGRSIIKGYDAYKLILKPIYKAGTYGQLTLYVTIDEFIPLRIDYHDRDNAIFKFLTVSKVMEQNGRVIPVRYDMMDIRSGTISILNFFSFDESVRFDKQIFRSEKLGE